MRKMFIPLLGIGISYMSGIISYRRYNLTEKGAALLYFIFISFIIWKGCQWLHIRMRGFYTVNQRNFSKLLSIISVSALYGFSVSGFMGLLWLRFAREEFIWATLGKFVLASVLAVILFTLVYEILYLSKEREIDTKIVDQLDHELTEAEISALRSEIDPHFIFNSLNTLSQLIKHDTPKAIEFNHRFAEVYKYFLLHKSTRWITLENEMNFVYNYFFLLQLRHGDKLHLNAEIAEEHKQMLIIPCAIQVLVENAIKHNSFSDDSPLVIMIRSTNEYVTVKNQYAPVNNPVESTRVGLRNLRSQFRIIAGKPLFITSDDQYYSVRLPLVSDPINLQ